MTNPTDPPDGKGRPEDVRFAIEVEIPSDVAYIERVVELVTRQCEEAHIPPHFCSLNVPVALTEALSNAILYGNRENPEKYVRVRAQLDPETLVLEVADEGAGFDLDSCTIDPSTPGNIDREDGRGLFLMRSLMDSVERFDNHGNVVRLVLRHG
jgi:serine/threonine-protein kinase RsbW